VRILTKKDGVTNIDVALDVTNFIETEEDTWPTLPSKRHEAGAGQISEVDVKQLQEFVGTGYKLATCVMAQSVAWDDFHLLQTRVQEKLVSLGMDEEVVVTFERARDPIIRRNTQLYHFMNNNITLILALMSIVGPIIFWPFAWWQRKTWYVTARFRINMTVDEYFPLVVEALP